MSIGELITPLSRETERGVISASQQVLKRDKCETVTKHSQRESMPLSVVFSDEMKKKIAHRVSAKLQPIYEELSIPSNKFLPPDAPSERTGAPGSKPDIEQEMAIPHAALECCGWLGWSSDILRISCADPLVVDCFTDFGGCAAACGSCGGVACSPPATWAGRRGAGERA